MDGRHRRTGNGPPGQNPAYRPTRPSPPARRTGLGAVRQVRPAVLRDDVGHGGKVLPTVYLNQSYAQARADRTASAAMSSSRTRRLRCARTGSLTGWLNVADRGSSRSWRRRNAGVGTMTTMRRGESRMGATSSPRSPHPYAMMGRPETGARRSSSTHSKRSTNPPSVGGQEPLAVTLRGRPWCRYRVDGSMACFSPVACPTSIR
jgi:hypothetical protein